MTATSRPSGALILKRGLGQRIRLQAGEETIWLTVHTLGQYGVRLLIEAPQSVVIAREELLPLAERRHAGGSPH